MPVLVIVLIIALMPIACTPIHWPRVYCFVRVCRCAPPYHASFAAPLPVIAPVAVMVLVLGIAPFPVVSTSLSSGS
jgi:hypothetical protein